MRKMKTYAVSAVALGGMFLIGSLLRSRDSQAKGATYSTPVTVMNTNAQPGSVLDAATATRIPYQSDRSSSCPNITGDCTFAFSTPPAGYRLVVEDVSGYFYLDLISQPLSGYLNNNHAPHNSFWGLNAPKGGFLGNVSGLNQKVLAYFDPGEIPTVIINAVFLEGSQQFVTVSGYLENCALTGCPAVQH